MISSKHIIHVQDHIKIWSIKSNTLSQLWSWPYLHIESWTGTAGWGGSIWSCSSISYTVESLSEWNRTLKFPSMRHDIASSNIWWNHMKHKQYTQHACYLSFSFSCCRSSSSSSTRATDSLATCATPSSKVAQLLQTREAFGSPDMV